MISVVERLNAFLSLALTHFCGVSNFEKSRCQFNEPFWINYSYLTHVFFGRHHKLVVNNPVWLSLEEGTAWVNINRLVLNQCPVSLLWILPRSMKEKASSYRLPNLRKIPPCTDYIQFVSVTDNRSIRIT